MKCIAAIEVDFDTSPIGTKSRLASDLLGIPVLTRTITQLLRSQRIEQLFVLCPPDQIAACKKLIPANVNGRATVRRNRIHAAPFRNLVRTARKWSLDGWRGGLGGTCSMDEYTRSDELALLAHEQEADALLCAPAAAPLIDPALVDAMIQHTKETQEESRLTFAQAPPGLVGTVYRTDLLVEMGQKGFPPGFVLSYKPDAPQMDLAQKSCCFTAPESVRHASGRLIVDTDRAFQTVHDFLESGLPVQAETVGRWLLKRAEQPPTGLAREVEIELTTDDQLPNALLRPRGPAVGRRGPIDLALVEKVAEELAALDDSLVVLGGFGEPLLHPKFDEVLGILSAAKVFGVAVRTNGIALDDARIDALLRYQVDVLNVVLDAWTPELYQAVQGEDRLGQVQSNLTNLAARRTECQSVAPLLVPEITKSVETVDELDAFFDGWVRETGWANIAGYSHYAGQREDRSVMRMSPPSRSACRRISQRMTVLADGRALLCDQDFTGQYAVANLQEQTLRECWNGPTMCQARRRHREGHFDAIAFCKQCDEWHRP